eukprot:11137515-Alexandrium_andersonii.AAC.1
MSASLVGSEMCIRDRDCAGIYQHARAPHRYPHGWTNPDSKKQSKRKKPTDKLRSVSLFSGIG